MAWTAPRTYVSGEIVTAAILNTDVRDNLLNLSTHAHGGSAGDGATLGTTPALVLSTSNVAGAATTHLRSNDQIALFDTTVPVTQASADVAATGSAAVAARRDHKHGMPTITGTTVIRKSAAETVNNSTTLQDDNHHTFAIAANEVWAVDLYLDLTALSGGMDFKFTFTLPAAASMLLIGEAQSDTQAALISAKGATPGTGIALTGMSNGANTSRVYIHGILVNGANAGTATFQWAQNSLVAADLTIGINSWMVARKV